jgi:hypothetical protein
MSKSLAKFDDESPLVPRLNPTVLSSVAPDSKWLLRVRAELSQDRELQQIYQGGQGKSPVAVADSVSSYLTAKWGSNGEEAYDAALYLAEEHAQLGQGIYLVDPATGKVVISLSEEDMWQPPDMAREDGSLVPQKRDVKPEIKAFLVTWTFEAKREKNLVASLIAKGEKVGLILDSQSSGLLVATRSGRKQITRGLVEHSPLSLLQEAGGTTGAFLRHFDISTPEEDKTPPEAFCGVVVAQTKMGIQDQSTINLHYNRSHALKGVVTQGWVREIARQLTLKAKDRFGGVEDILASKLCAAHLGDRAWFWIAPPELVGLLHKIKPELMVLPAVGAELVGFLKPKVGQLFLPKDFGAEHHEANDSWEVKGELHYRLLVDWEAVKYLSVDGIEYQGQVVQ